MSSGPASFADLRLDPRLLAGLDAAAHDAPTPIQAQAIPLILKGRDVLGLAQTGTGKTAAFGLPLAHRLLAEGRMPRPRELRCLILAPTRELVAQIAHALLTYCRETPLRIHSVYGGASAEVQAARLEKGADILVATPGRLTDLMARGAVDLRPATKVVIDEADHMLDLGFAPILLKILNDLPRRRQTLMFSATMPDKIAQIAAKVLTDPVRIEAEPPGKPPEALRQGIHFLSNRDKATALRDHLATRPGARTLVFAATREKAEKLAGLLQHWGIAAAALHGDRSQAQREAALRAFRDGTAPVLVATDIAARGLDIPGVTLVVNHDLPADARVFVHRVGRTARAGAGGEALSFCAPAEIGALAAIEAGLGAPLPVIAGQRWPEAPAAAAPRRKPKR